jgi:hypothetical protein
MIRAPRTGLPPAVTVPLTTGIPPAAGTTVGVDTGDMLAFVGVGSAEAGFRGDADGVDVAVDGAGVADLVRAGVPDGRPDAAA